MDVLLQSLLLLLGAVPACRSLALLLRVEPAIILILPAFSVGILDAWHVPVVMMCRRTCRVCMTTGWLPPKFPILGVLGWVGAWKVVANGVAVVVGGVKAGLMDTVRKLSSPDTSFSFVLASVCVDISGLFQLAHFTSLLSTI